MAARSIESGFRKILVLEEEEASQNRLGSPLKSSNNISSQRDHHQVKKMHHLHQIPADSRNKSRRTNHRSFYVSILPHQVCL